MSDSSITPLRDQLRKLLEREKPDFGRILEVSSQLASLDPDNVRFTADAGLISRLGLQLVARQETAVSELVKNAYDADARTVRLVFSADSTKPGGRLLIDDDGNGMDREQLIGGFMRLASADKIHHPVSPRFKRQRAGRKGIGRFAVQRLGRSLTLITQIKDATHALQIRIDWNKFNKEQDLFNVASRIEPVEKRKSCGTTLIIDGLREAWSDSQIARVYRYIEELLQPSFGPSVTSREQTDKNTFDVTFYRLKGAKEIPIASEETMVFDHALARVRGHVDSRGKGVWEVESVRLNLKEVAKISASSAKSNRPFKSLQGVKFEAYYFIWDSSLIPGQERPRLQQLAERSGGIKLYRNGFRVLPYGEPKDDWLGLDEEYRRRRILVPLSNINWFGYVEVHDPHGERFEETSSREGLANNDAFREMVCFVSESLKAGALRIAEVRGKKGRAGQRNYKTKTPLTPSEKLNTVADALEKVASTLHKPGGDSEAAANAEKVVARAVEDIRESATASEEQLQENDMLRVLGSLGLTIGIFTHEVRLRMVDLYHELHTLTKQRNNAEAKRALNEMEKHFAILKSYTAYFDATISANVRREREPQDLSWILHDFIRQFTPVARRDNIEFKDIDIEPEGLITPPMHSSEWASILTNLFTNSRKAILRRDDLNEGAISIHAWSEKNRMIIDFIDNGDGIPKENCERIFNAFFTTTHSAEAAAERDPTGTGLGLKIVRDIVSTAGGEVYVAPPPKTYSTCLRIELSSGD